MSRVRSSSEGKLELMNTAGNVVSIDLGEVKGVYFVREFGDSESLTRKTFTSRPTDWKVFGYGCAFAITKL